jgi:hypothetical protein
MKKIMAIVAITAISVSSFGGNVDAGRIEIGGSAGLSTSTVNNSSSSFWMDPYAMFYLVPRLALGGSIGLGIYSAGHYSTTGIDIGPRVAYYFDIGNPTFYPFVAGGLSFYHSSTHNDHDNPSSVNNFSIPLEGGVRFFLNDFVAADGGLYLNFRDGTTDMSIRGGFSMFLR